MPFNVEILGKDSFLTALETASDNLRASLQSAIGKSTAVLAKYTTSQDVPWKTGNLAQTFIADVGELWASWMPTASYAGFVEFGTQPHEILPKNGRALFWPGLRTPVTRVHHPGTKANDYLGRILAASQPEIDDLFYQALQLVVQDMNS